MSSQAVVLGAFALLARRAMAFEYNSTGTIYDTRQFQSSMIMCNNSLSYANATGVFSTTPGLASGSSNQGNGTAFGTEVSWAVVGADNPVTGAANSGLQGSLMFSPGKADYFDDNTLGYDACGIALDPGAFNGNTFLRGQSDNGSCLQTFDLTCKSAIQDMVNAAAASNNQPSNQNGYALPGICSGISAALGSSPPKVCSPFFQDGIKWIYTDFTLTQTPNTSVSSLSKACSVSSFDNTSTFYNVETLLASYSDSTYDILVSVPWPLITVFMPIANGASTSSIISKPYSDVTCLRITDVTAGSRAKPVEPAAGPVDYSSLTSNTTSNTTLSATASASASSTASAGISSGAIAGIVVGAIAAVTLLIVAIFFFMHRSRRRHGAVEATELDAGYSGLEKRKASAAYSEIHGESVHEMSPDSHMTSELPSPQPRHELPAMVQKHEMDAGRPPVELPADFPLKEKTDRYG